MWRFVLLLFVHNLLCCWHLVAFPGNRNLYFFDFLDDLTNIDNNHFDLIVHTIYQNEQPLKSVNFL